jgi:hypothetical protein
MIIENPTGGLQSANNRAVPKHFEESFPPSLQQPSTFQ